MNPIGRFLARLKFRRRIKTDESSNVVDSIVKARQLYKDPSRKDVAEDIMQRVTANRHNYSALMSLKNEIEEKLK